MTREQLTVEWEEIVLKCDKREVLLSGRSPMAVLTLLPIL